MRSSRRIIAVGLVVALLVAGLPMGQMGRASAQAAEAGIVLPVGEVLDDEALQDVTGKALPLAGVAMVAARAAAAWVGVKLAESAWNNVIEPALDKYVWSPVREKLGL
ncbi:MAG TPA: hypothetical protein VIK98_03840 [Limnochordales bacterium]